MKLDPAGIRYDGGTNQTVRVNRAMPAEPSKGNDTNFYLALQHSYARMFRTIACPPPPLFRWNGCDMPPCWHASRPCTCTLWETMRQRTAYPCRCISRLGDHISLTNSGSSRAPRSWLAAPLRACPFFPSSWIFCPEPPRCIRCGDQLPNDTIKDLTFHGGFRHHKDIHWN